MLSIFRKLSKDVLLYGGGRIFLQLVNLVAIPVYTYFFMPTDFAVIETVSVISSVISVLAIFGLDSAAQRSYFDYKPEQNHERTRVLSTAFWTLFVSTTTASFIFFINSGWIAEILLGTISYRNLLVLAILTIPFTQSFAFLLETFRLRNEPIRYGILSGFNALLSFLLAFYLIAIARIGLVGYFIGVTGGVLASLTAMLLTSGFPIRFVFEKKELKVMLAYGLPLVPVSAAMWVLQLSDRFFLLTYFPNAELGLYSLGNRLSGMLNFGVMAFSLAWAPFYLTLYNNDPEKEKEVRVKTLNLVATFLCAGSVFLSTFAREFFTYITDPAYIDAHKVVGLLTGSNVLIGMNTVLMSGISITRKTHYFAWYTLISAGINILMNFIFIPSLGMVGAALATLVSYGALSLLYYFRSQKLSYASFDIRRLGWILGATLVVNTTAPFIMLESVWQTVALKIIFVVIYLLVIFFKGIDKKTKSVIIETIYSKIKHREEIREG